MPEPVCRFTDAGLQAFVRWFRTDPQAELPADLLRDPAQAVPLCEAEPPPARFADQYAFGSWLVRALSPLDARAISYDVQLWSWLAARFFDQLCPRDLAGTRRKPRSEEVYIPTVPRVFYRHLVRLPWFMVGRHGEAAKFLLTASDGGDVPLARISTLLNALASRQFIVTSPTLIAAATALYVDPRTGRVRRGAAGEGRGSVRRLALIANQLSLTYDIHEMPVDRFLQLLPEEFKGWW